MASNEDKRPQPWLQDRLRGDPPHSLSLRIPFCQSKSASSGQPADRWKEVRGLAATLPHPPAALFPERKVKRRAPAGRQRQPCLLDHSDFSKASLVSPGRAPSRHRPCPHQEASEVRAAPVRPGRAWWMPARLVTCVLASGSSCCTLARQEGGLRTGGLPDRGPFQRCRGFPMPA